MEVTKYFWMPKKFRKHSEVFPESFRCLIIGQSGSGKTALLMRMLLEENLLDFNKLYVFGRSLHQPEYQLLKCGFDNKLNKTSIVDILNHSSRINEENEKPENIIVGISQELDDNEKSDISCEYYEDPDNIPDPKEFDEHDKNLIIFDDIMTDKNQSKPGAFFTRSRHNNIDCIYISQNYYRLPRHTIRTNSNFLVLFNLDPRDTDQLYRDSGSSVDFKDINTFRQLCQKAWSKKYGYLVIDKSKSDLNQKYRFQLELENSNPIVENVLDQPIYETSRTTKTCLSCNLTMLSSSYSKHIKSKKHNINGRPASEA